MDDFFGNKSYINLIQIFASPCLRLRRSVLLNKFSAACPYWTAAFWKEATIVKALPLLGLVNSNDIAFACIYLLRDAL